MDRSKIFQCIAVIVLSAACGAMGYVTRTADSKEKISKAMLLIQTLSAAVSGCLVLLICMHYEFDMIVAGIMSGVSGWMGGAATIGMITNQVRSKLGVDSKESGGPKNGD